MHKPVLGISRWTVGAALRWQLRALRKGGVSTIGRRPRYDVPPIVMTADLLAPAGPRCSRWPS
eukprot:4007018-Alexandrium_andersonii.AAC.1